MMEDDIRKGMCICVCVCVCVRERLGQMCVCVCVCVRLGHFARNWHTTDQLYLNKKNFFTCLKNNYSIFFN